MGDRERIEDVRKYTHDTVERVGSVYLSADKVYELCTIALRALDARDAETATVKRMGTQWSIADKSFQDALRDIQRLQARLDAVEMLVREVATQDCTRGGFPVRLVTLARKWLEGGNDVT